MAARSVFRRHGEQPGQRDGRADEAPAVAEGRDHQGHHQGTAVTTPRSAALARRFAALLSVRQ